MSAPDADAAPALCARGVRKSFGDDGVLDGVDLTVRDDETLALLGPNGVGKTVLLSCLAGATTPTAGEVEVFGRPRGDCPGEHTSYLRQEALTVPSLTGRENVRFYGRVHPAFTDRWERYVDDLGVADALDDRVSTYSGGMRRKLELAIALSVDAPVYLLDEPTAGVDVSMVECVHDFVRERREAGATVVLSSHRPADVDLADRVAFVREGHVGAVDDPDALLDAVPPVVRVRGTAAAGALAEFAVDDEVFEEGGDVRGFLRPDASVEAVERAFDADAVTVADPTFTDLFNYHVHLPTTAPR
ncbi:ABC transporter ATP-binding protein [Halostella litorea]|uniref:ABC transporter ATP-binding protein n=1 Tax=Halostella litorea TaxID=2528831 RepID=UPI001092A61B|nr:ABC transporter ATP-binding protein [Halostella litorea]